MVLLLAAVKEASDEFDNPRKHTHTHTQERLLEHCDTQRSSSCSTSTTIQSLEKSSVAEQQNVFLLRPQLGAAERPPRPPHVDIKRMSSDNGGGDSSGGRPRAGRGCAGRGGGPGGLGCGSMTGFRQNKGKMEPVGPVRAR